MPERTKKRIGVCTSDWHLTADVPYSRSPEFVTDQYEKVEEIQYFCCDLALEHPEWEVYLLNAGDVHDKARIPRWLSSEYLSLLSLSMFTHRFVHIACAGQHDQLYHSTKLDDTSLQGLYSSGCVQRYGRGIYTADWGMNYSEYDDVIVAHVCCTEKHNPYIDYSVTARELLDRTKAQVLVTGDYHKAHFLKHEGRLVVNPGSVMRLNSGETKKKPSIYVVDLDEAEVLDQVFLAVKPASEVFDLTKISQEKADEKRDEELRSRFDEYLHKVQTKAVKPDFDKVLEKVITDMTPSEAVKQEIEEAVNG